MDPIWITVAFIFGFIVRQINLPPLVGYLFAGFFLRQIGAESGEFIDIISELGVLLLLFTIGLKFKISDLLRKEIWASTLIYTAASTIIYGIIIFIFSSFLLHITSDLSFIGIFFISFALSFSSTVFSIKTLEDKGEVQSFHGRISIGVLIIQDLLAVILMAVIYSNDLSLWILILPIILFVVRPILLKIFDWIGHGELLVLYGFFLALVVGAESFKILGLKPDLGALVIGMLVSEHSKAKEMANILMNFKDVFLVGFFLSIGLSGLPTKPILLLAGIITLLLPIKSFLYLSIFTKFRLRSRTSFHSAITLSTFSEFGLIITVSGISIGIIEYEWVTILALILSLSYLVASPFTSKAHKIYAKYNGILGKLETSKRLEGDRLINIGDAQILIFGMGRVGNAVYDQLTKQYDQKVLGIDFDEDAVNKSISQGKKVIQDDATDSEFWEKIKKTKSNQVKLVMFCFNDYKNILFAIERMREIDFMGTIAALAEFDDQVKHLKDIGVAFPFNFYSETGIGFADSVCEFIDNKFGD
jgi:predicted Kef-type K+ transport protein